MREIKFDFIYKGVNGFHHKQYYLCQLMAESHPAICDLHHQMDLIAWRDFTGLHDNNGKEIYERDIAYIAKAKEHREIRFSDGAFRIFASDGDSWPMNQERAIGMMVVGNAFEHPHLMEAGNAA